MREQISSLIQPLLEQQYLQCATIAILHENHPSVFSFNSACSKDALLTDGDTLFEIGSITKLFTLLLLADLVKDEIIDLNSPLNTFLPNIPELRIGQKALITIRHLLWHEAGWRDPEIDWRQPDTFTRQLRDTFLAACLLQSEPGAQAAYSNIGYGLLGNILQQVTGTDYFQLLHTRIFHPLGMCDTVLTLSPHQRARLAPGHLADGTPTLAQNLDKDSPLLACGHLKSTANDMLLFMQAWVKGNDSAIGSIFAAAGKHLGWSSSLNGMLVEGGKTSGHLCFMFLDRAQQCGRLVLGDTSTFYTVSLCNSIGDLVEHGKNTPVALPQLLHAPFTGDPVWVGNYQLPADKIFSDWDTLEIGYDRGEWRMIGRSGKMIKESSCNLQPMSNTSVNLKGLDIEIDFKNGKLKLIPGATAKSILFSEPITCERIVEDAISPSAHAIESIRDAV